MNTYLVRPASRLSVMLVIFLALSALGLLLPGVASASAPAQAASWPNCNFNCNANDVNITDLFVADVNGDPLPSCNAGDPVSASLWATFANGTSSSRTAVVVLADLYLNNVLDSQLNTAGTPGVCGGDVIAPGSANQRLVDFTWTCGQSVDLRNIVISWDTSPGATCSAFFDRPTCSNRGAKCFASAITVARPLVEADFTAPDVCLGQPTQFTNLSAGGVSPISFGWNFGDGNTSSLKNPSHLYTAAGAYTVSLSMQDASTPPATSSTTKPVRVYGVPAASFVWEVIGEDAETVTLRFESTSILPEPTNQCVPTYEWKVNETVVGQTSSVEYTFQRASPMAITLTVTACGCSSSFSFEPVLAVTLADFYAEQEGDHIRITWATVTEMDNAGFNLYRSTSPGVLGERLNAALIPAQAPGSTLGFTYTFDDFSVTPGQTYWYTLEDVDFSGLTTRHGPVSAVVVVAPTSVALAGLEASPVQQTWQPYWLALAALAALAAAVKWQRAARSRQG